jgi:hypothetical protein
METEQEEMDRREAEAQFHADWNKLTDRFFPASGRSSWDFTFNLSARDERRMLKSEGEGD